MITYGASDPDCFVPMRTALALLSALFIAACAGAPAAPPPDIPVPRTATPALCNSLLQFVRARLGPGAVRKAVFLPSGPGASSVPMIAEPRDNAARVFEHRDAGRLAGHLRAPRFAATLAGCLGLHEDFTALEYASGGEYTRASFEDGASKRRVEISATESTTTVLITADPGRVKPR